MAAMDSYLHRDDRSLLRFAMEDLFASIDRGLHSLQGRQHSPTTAARRKLEDDDGATGRKLEVDDGATRRKLEDGLNSVWLQEKEGDCLRLLRLNRVRATVGLCAHDG
ncbi:hypothetical protein Dsin_005432 [Dipteronia sinensis]|uniref:Uncharacterized protein n=1 Tax=Dipteronia sinensis TaxID=43782 RepID=A0AAE0AXJ7_9ROSI|nr:hypothetical protein Dsin_005432 [Dipteronia sinensis]